MGTIQSRVMNVLDLFSGIGGFSLGLERAGFKTVAFCESDEFCRRVLAKHWPDVVVYDDVRALARVKLVADSYRWRQPQLAQCNGKSQDDGPSQRDDIERLDIDVICGGFPCQDISVAGKGAGIEGERSGLWKEFARIIGEVRPRYVIVENVSALLGRGLSRVLGDLAALGYDAEWHCIPACAVGAPHRRDRVWIVAYVGGDQLRQQSGRGNGARGANQAIARNNGAQEFVAYPDSGNGFRRSGALQMGWGRIAREIANNGEFARAQWGVEPGVGRVAYGVPARVDRLRALGNALVPQIAEIIGRVILTVDSVHSHV